MNQYVISLLLCLLLPMVVLSDLSTSPSDITVALGSPAYFQCASGEQSFPQTTWTEYYTNPNPAISPQKLFYVDPTNQNQVTYASGVDSNKYVRNGTTNLIITNTQVKDGEVYGCSPTSGATGYANLVVIGALTLTITPSSGVTVGSMISIQCSLNYGAPNVTNLYKNLSSSQDPAMEIMMDGQPMNNVNVYRQDANTKVALVNQTTVTQQFVGADITCAVTSTPQNGATVYSNTTTSVGIPAPPREITILTINGTSVDPNKVINLRENDQINCSARGYPIPTITWKNLNYNFQNPSSGNVGSGWGILTLNTARDNQEWQCIATNTNPNGTVLTTPSVVYKFNVKPLTGQSVGGGASTIYGSFLWITLTMISLLLLENRRKKST